MKRLIAIFAAVLSGMALFAAPDSNEQPWKASWITKEYQSGLPNTWLGFRKSFDIASVPESVIARISADTRYWLWINGELVVREGGLKRGPAPGDSYYDKVEIAPYLKSGSNLVAVMIWFMGQTGFSHLSSGVPALLFDAEGEGVEMLSDDTWQCGWFEDFSETGTPKPNYRLPESSVRFDARRYQERWTSDPSGNIGKSLALGFTPGRAPFGRLVERPIPQWKDYGLSDYLETHMSGDTLVCKLPYNCHVAPYLKVEAPAGKVIGLQTDHPDVNGVPCVTGEYVTKDGVQEYEHWCWMNGEYVKYILPDGVKVLDVKYRETGYDTEFTGSFHCDDELLNDYWKRAQRTLYVCMRDTYYDCPDRERAQWWGDEVNELGEAFYALSPSSHKLARKGIYELMRWQAPDGSIYAPVPASNWGKELPQQMLASVGWYGFREYAFSSGDYSFVADIYDGLHRYLHETWKLDENGLPIYRKGGWDWPDAGEHQDRYAQIPPLYYQALMAEKEFAEYLGKASDAAEDEAMMARIAESFNRIYWNGSSYRTPDHDDVADDRVQALAIVTGIAGPDKYDAIMKVFETEYHATTYMFKYVLEALCRMGHPELALERMHRMYPTVMKDGCTTLYEHWNFDGTCNHAWTGSGIIVAGRLFAGIAPLEPGFKTFSVNPQMGSLKEIDCSVDTVSGLISVSLRKKGKRTQMTLTVPDGTKADVTRRDGSHTSLDAGVHSLVL